ncbi:MAG: hypothetical protein IKG18_08105 [Atopobiaceae bacterium]|nr:hypothetical protein [Atopobiaceae bacterium]
MGIEDIEGGVGDIEREIEQLEVDSEAVGERREAVDEAVSQLARDVAVVEALSDNRHAVEAEERELQDRHADLVNGLSTLNAQLIAQMEALDSDRSVLSDLAAVGEDVSEAMAILDDRQQWLESCQEQMMELGDRLDAALEAYELGDGGAATSGPSGTDGSTDSARLGDGRMAGQQGAASGGVPRDDLDSDFSIDPDLWRLIDRDSHAGQAALSDGAMDIVTVRLQNDLDRELEIPAEGTGGWKQDKELIDWYRDKYRDTAASRGASPAQLDRLDRMFYGRLNYYRGKRAEAATRLMLTGGGGLTPGFGPYRDPLPTQLRDAQRVTDEAEVRRQVEGLRQTNEPTMRLPDGTTVYDSPEMMVAKLDWYQGLAYSDYQGTCGLCSVLNIARLAGKNLSERDIVSLACRGRLCKTGSHDPGENGGTNPFGRQELLRRVGIESRLDNNHDAGHIADLVESGRGVIASVDVRSFWRGASLFDQAGGHAVVITSVERDARGNPTFFHVCDSGIHDANFRVDASRFMASLRPGRGLNVTTNPIR